MILTLTASIMYWSLQQPAVNTEAPSETEENAAVSEPSTEDAASDKSPSDKEDESVVANNISNLSVDDAASDTSQIENGNDAITEWLINSVHPKISEVKEESTDSVLVETTSIDPQYQMAGFFLYLKMVISERKSFCFLLSHLRRKRKL